MAPAPVPAPLASCRPIVSPAATERAPPRVFFSPYPSHTIKHVPPLPHGTGRTFHPHPRQHRAMNDTPNPSRRALIATGAVVATGSLAAAVHGPASGG